MFTRFFRTVPRMWCYLSRSNKKSPVQQTDKELLRQALQSLIYDQSKAVWLLKIMQCNALESSCFSRAHCMVKSSLRDISAEAFPFASLYLKGVSILEHYLNGNGLKNLKRPERNAVDKLVAFLENEKELTDQILKIKRNSVYEVEWAAALALYLLQELSVSPEFVLDEFYPKRELMDPELGRLIKHRFSDTSIGNPEVWHGCADLLIGDNLGVQVDVDIDKSNALSDENYEVEFSESEQTSFEIKDDKGLGYQKDPILSEAIAFGCLQKVLYPELVTLAPTVGISKEKVVFYFYDSKNDILIESSVFDLFGVIMDSANSHMAEEKYCLSFETILALWLTLNYKYLSSGVTQSMISRKDFRAGFWEKLPCDKKDIYSKQLHIGGSREGIWRISDKLPLPVIRDRKFTWSPERDMKGHIGHSSY